MPRPSKRISPDTLGGRIRATREHLHLSLADVACGHYSPSFISQIERNRVDPSQESLRFLASRLKIPYEDLEVLAHQRRERESEAHSYKSYEELRSQAAEYLSKREPQRAIDVLEGLYFPQVPGMQRWRLAALRGHSYYEMKKYLQAQKDFVYALNELPRPESAIGQRQDIIHLYLHLAGTYRELQQLDAALEHYKTALQMINKETPFGYVAEAHWGIAHIIYAQAKGDQRQNDLVRGEQTQRLQTALRHAEEALIHYRSMGELIRVAALGCQIAQIEEALGYKEQEKEHLEEILAAWSGIFDEPLAEGEEEKQQQERIANIVSVAACMLANLALVEEQYEVAIYYVERALLAGQRCYTLRRADAYLMRGRILEARDPRDPAVEEAFRKATEELRDSQRIEIRISAHVRFSKHLLRVGKCEEGQRELERACLLSDLILTGSDVSTEGALVS